MKKVKIKFVEQEMLPRTWHGIDFGVDLHVLVKFGPRMVVWQKGHSYWSGHASDYDPASFVVLNPAGRKHGLNYVDVHQSRLSAKHFPVIAEKLMTYLEVPMKAALMVVDAMYRAYKGRITAVVELLDS